MGSIRISTVSMQGHIDDTHSYLKVGASLHRTLKDLLLEGLKEDIVCLPMHYDPATLIY